MEYAGLFGSVALLIWLALRGVNIIFASLLCSLLVILTSGLPLAESLNEYYSFGSLGAFTFAGKFFLLFAAGAVFGRAMGESHAASSIALALIRVMGGHRALIITTLACAVLTYGGVVAFVVIFAIYPLGLKLLQEANIPKRLFCGAIALGAGTFTMTALPGTPSVHNVISASALGTDLFAGFWVGIIAGLLMLVMGLWYLERQRVLAANNGEYFVPGPTDRISTVDARDYPDWKLSCLPLIFVILVIILPRVFSLTMDIETIAQDSVLFTVLKFALSQPILWPSIALAMGTLLAVVLFAHIRDGALKVLGDGTQDSILPLINTAAVVGFGGIVVHTAGFVQFSDLMIESSLPPLISAFSSISLVSAITGSATGGLQIFMQTMAPAYIEMGVEAQTLHRIATMAAGGFDSLPHCGAIIVMLSVTGLNHKEAYRDVGVITVVIPVVVTLTMIGIVGLF